MQSSSESIATRYAITAALLLILAGCADVPRAPTSTSPVTGEVNYEGLQTVRVRRFEIGQVRPGTDFSRYTGFLFEEPELAFRTPDRGQREVDLDDEQKRLFKEYVDEVFTAALNRLDQPRRVDEPGPDVMRLGVRLQDIRATVPPRSVGMVGRAAIALQAVGEVTLVLELHDSVSGEIVARVVDTKAVEGVAVAKDGGVVTRWEDVERIVDRWAEITRSGLEAVARRR